MRVNNVVLKYISHINQICHGGSGMFELTMTDYIKGKYFCWKNLRLIIMMTDHIFLICILRIIKSDIKLQIYTCLDSPFWSLPFSLIHIF